VRKISPMYFHAKINTFTRLRLPYQKIGSAVADSVNCIIFVIRNKQGSVRHYKDIHRSSPGCKSLKPAVGKRFITYRLSILQPDKGNPVSDWDFSIPGAMFWQ